MSASEDGPTPTRSTEAFAADAAAFTALFDQPADAGPGKTILILDRGSTGYIRYEIYLYRLLQLRGYSLVCVGWRHPEVVRYYELLNIPYHYWEEFTPHVDAADVHARFGAMESVDAIRQIAIDGVRLGLHALAECLRAEYLERRRDSVAYGAEIPVGIVQFLVRGLQAVAAAAAILARFRPETVIVGDGLYTLQGTFLDLCVSQGIDAIHILPALEDSTLYLKRCTSENRDWPYTFLSAALWTRILRAGAWNQALSASFHERHRQGYLSGAWCSLQALTKNTETWRGQETRRYLGIEETAKLAVIFPHLVWDTPVYGQNLFSDHASWLIAVVRAAMANHRVRWIIKLHPANVFSTKNEDFKASSNFAELALIEKAIGPLPPHVRVLRPDTTISTYSLLEIADYCLTETGTVGMEGAAMGVAVLTAGKSHYAGKGFTVDPLSQDDLVDHVRRIHELPGLSEDARARAERYAYASFYLKPFRLRSMAIRFSDATNSGIEVEPRVGSVAELAAAPDMNELLNWLTDPSAKDYLSEDMRRFTGTTG